MVKKPAYFDFIYGSRFDTYNYRRELWVHFEYATIGTRLRENDMQSDELKRNSSQPTLFEALKTKKNMRRKIVTANIIIYIKNRRKNITQPHFPTYYH